MRTIPLRASPVTISFLKDKTLRFLRMRQMPKRATLEEFVKTQREFIHITQGFNNEDLVARFPISGPPSIIVQELLLCYLMAVRAMIQEDELEITDHIL